jgi:hypothetical protein
LGPIHEPLVGRLYRTMECIPRRIWNEAKKRKVWVRPHRGKRRFIETGSTIHQSVIDRMRNPTMAYRPSNVPSQHVVEG